MHFKTNDMLAIRKNANLKSYNTFGIEINAQQMVDCPTQEHVVEVIKLLIEQPQTYLVLGGGSNLLFSNDFKGLIIHPTIKGIEIVAEDDDHVRIKAGAGEEWDDLVAYCVKNNYYGLEIYPIYQEMWVHLRFKTLGLMA